MQGRTVLITGGNTGIGKETAIAIARSGGRVVITSRDSARGEAALEDIRRDSGSQEVHVLGLDLSRFASIREAAREFANRFDALHVLVNNAGHILGDRRETEEGFEATFGVNHLGHFLLTDLLLPVLEAAGGARVVNVSSEAHRYSRGLDFDDLQFARRRFASMTVYAASKLANIYFTRSLARRVHDRNITVNCVHPGVVGSRFGGDGDMGPLFSLGMTIARPFMLSPRSGAKTSIHVATSPELGEVTGEYFTRSRIRRPSRAARDEEAAERLWDVSRELIAQHPA